MVTMLSFHSPFLPILVLSLSGSLLVPFWSLRASVFTEDFLNDPGSHGWDLLGVSHWGGQSLLYDRSGGTALSPGFAVEPNQFYRVQIEYSGSGLGSLGTFFTNPIASYNNQHPDYAERESQLLFDNHTQIPLPGESRSSFTTYFRSPSQATGAFFRINSGDSFEVFDVEAHSATRSEVATWTTRQRQAFGAIRPSSPQGARFDSLSSFIQKLRAGDTVRVAMVGDSIVADTMNAHFQLGLEARYPGTEIILLEAVGNGTGLGSWNDPNPHNWKNYDLNFDAAVLEQSPDLVIFGGISNRGTANAEATGQLIDRILAHFPEEDLPSLLLMTGTDLFNNKFETGRNRLAAYKELLESVAEKKEVAFFDIYENWSSFVDELQTISLIQEDLERDPYHFNDLGKQTLALSMESYFAAIPEPSSTALIVTTSALLPLGRRKWRANRIKKTSGLDT